MNSVDVLLDMDDTAVDFITPFSTGVASILPPEILAKWDKSLYWIEEAFEEQYHESLHDIIRKQGFFLNLQPKPGALDAIEQMLDRGLSLRICTTPHKDSLFCREEKTEWIRKYLGDELADNIAFETDKTGVPGKILVDDKAEIIGETTPSWKHVVFHAPYNAHIITPHRLERWKDWKRIILPILERY